MRHKTIMVLTLLTAMTATCRAVRIANGDTGRKISFVAVDATDFSTRETGLSSFTVYYDFEGGGDTAMTTPTVTESDATNLPGVYWLDVDESGMVTLTAGVDEQECTVHITHAGMAPITRAVEVFRPKITEGSTSVAQSADNPTAATIADAVADEVVSDTAHNTANTIGRRLRQISDGLVVHEGTAQAGYTSSITLDIDASSSNNFYIGDIVVIRDGQGAGQSGVINAYVGATRVATVGTAWASSPDNTSEYLIISGGTNLADAVKFSNDSTAANNAEAFFDDSGFNAANSTIGTVTTHTNERGTDNAALATTLESRLTAARAGYLDNLNGHTAQTGDSFARIGANGAGLSAIPWVPAWDAEIQSEVVDAILLYHLDHLFAATYDPASRPGAADALLNELIENDGGVSRFTANALEQAPSGSGGDATAANQTTIISHLTDVKGGTFSGSTDSLEAIRDRGDAAWTTGSTGSGSVVVDHDYGGSDNLAYKTGAGVGIDNAVVRAYLKTNYDAGNTGSAYIVATTTTDVNGQWEQQMNLDPATYTLYYFKQGSYGPDTQEVTVE